jgi:6-phosphogluconolactonase (cycloisomerase 2 family)
MMSKSKLTKSLGVLLVVGALAGMGTIPAAGAPSAAGAGVLEFIEAKSGDLGLGGAFAVAVSPDGKHIYVAGISDDAVAAFSRNSSTGKLTFVEAEVDEVNGVDGLEGANGVAVSPDGKHVYVIGTSDDALAAFTRNATTGALAFIEVHKDDSEGGTADGLDNASSVAVSPDGKWVYVTGNVDDALAVFRRDSTTGALTYFSVHKDEVFGVDGLNGAVSVAPSPDGKHVYVAGILEDAVAVFEWRTPPPWYLPVLTYEDVIRDGVGDVDGLSNVGSVVVSPDGKHVYTAAGTDDHAVAVFTRNSITGALDFVQVVKDTDPGVDGLYGAQSVIVSPDGEYVYALGKFEDALAVFRRDGTSGELTFVEVEVDDTNGVDGLDGASEVAVSPDGEHVYVAGQSDNAVALLARRYPIYLPLVPRND